MIEKIVDGDTLHLRDGRKVRLIGINAPELGFGDRADQPLARESKQAAQVFLPPGARARLLLDQQYHDRHGRWLAHVYNQQGQSLEAHLLSMGLAWHVAVPPNLTLAPCLAAVEVGARQRRQGVWETYGVATVAAGDLKKGGYQRVSGRVLSIHFSKAWWINLDGRLSGVIYPEHQHRFDRETVAGWQGRSMVLEGWVYRAGEKARQPWRVRLETPYSVEPLTGN